MEHATRSGVTINEMFGQTEINYIVGNSHTLWPAKPGSIGRPYPGHRVALIDEDGNEVPPGEIGDVAVNRTDIHGDRDAVFFLGYWKNEVATRDKYTRRLVPHRRSRAAATMTVTSGTRDARTTSSRPPATASDPPRSKTAWSSIRPSRTRPWCRVPTRARQCRQGVHRADAGPPPSASLEDEIRSHVRGRLAPYEYPKEIEFIDALPMTTTGKVQRRVLRLREAERKRGGA